MSAALALARAPAERGRLVSEGLSQRDERTYRPSQSSHAGHGCCQDAYRPSTVGVLLGANEGVRSLVGTNEHGQALTFALRCRSWGCACCARKLRARNRAKALMGATGRVVFFTLTIDPSDGRYVAALGAYEGKGETAPSIRYGQWAWNRMTARCRARGWSFPYARGVELHASGRAHLHVIARVESVSEFFILRNMLRGGWATRAGFGAVVDVQIARSGADVARYVGKATNAGAVAPVVRSASLVGARAAAYVTKGLDARMPKYTRRASFARGWAEGWVRPTPIAGFSWRVAPASVDVVRRGLMLSDFVMVEPERFRVPIAAMAAGG